MTFDFTIRGGNIALAFAIKDFTAPGGCREMLDCEVTVTSKDWIAHSWIEFRPAHFIEFGSALKGIYDRFEGTIELRDGCGDFGITLKFRPARQYDISGYIQSLRYGFGEPGVRLEFRSEGNQSSYEPLLEDVIDIMSVLQAR